MTPDLPNVSKGWEYFSHPRPPHAAAVSSLPRPGLLTCTWGMAPLYGALPPGPGLPQDKARGQAERTEAGKGELSPGPQKRGQLSVGEGAARCSAFTLPPSKGQGVSHSEGAASSPAG